MDNENELFEKGEFEHKLGPNIIEQFVKSHDLIGMIAELIQNDFDAKSRKTKIHFQEDRLVVNGSGIEIDTKGWERLSYWLGVGQDLAKKGGIGKKNFGLRSLFIIGNRLVISSGGYKTALDMEMGARQKRIKETTIYPENFSFRLEVNYRDEPLGKLSIFSKEHEEDLFNSLTKYLIYFIQLLVCSNIQKLCTTKDGKILGGPYKIEIISDRLGKSIISNVKMWEDKHIKGLLNRKINQKVIENGEINSKEIRITEILHPIEHLDNIPVNEIPNYYRSKNRKKVITGISFAVDKKGKNPLLTSGKLFYPIGMIEKSTGLGFSLNGPFILDMDRDRIVHDDDWNKYLLTQTGKELGEVFSNKILPKYGPLAYLLFISDNIDNAYLEFYENALKSMGKYIINDYYDPKKKIKPNHFCQIFEEETPRAYLPSKVLNDKVIPLLDFYPIMVSHMGKERAISRHLTKSLMNLDERSLRNFLDEFKIKIFTIHNICELLVNDGETKYKFSKGTVWHYSSKELFKKAFSNVDYITLHLDILHRYWDLLTIEEIRVIKESNWLQAADNSLKCFNDLTLWERDPKDFIWPNKYSIIHSKLAKHPIFKRKNFKLSPFNIIKIIEEKAEEWDELGDNDKEVIFKFIVKNWRYILGEKWRKNQGSTKELKNLKEIVKKYPILKDSKGEWVYIQDLRVINEKLRLIFGSSLHYPHLDIPKRLLSVLKAPTELQFPEDIIERCDTLESATKEEIFSFEDYLSKKGFNKEVKNEIYEHMWSVCKVGDEEKIIKTTDAYIPSEKLDKLLGTTIFPYLIIRNGSVNKFFQRIGVRDNPYFEDMVEYLNYLKNNNEYLKDKDLFYEELVNAAEREQLKKEEVSTQHIILIAHELYPPEKVIISTNLSKYFRKGLRYWTESKLKPKLRNSLKRLGCREKLGKDNIIDFLTWVDEKYESNENVGLEEREGIHRAYLELKSFPDEKMADDKKIFLSKSGHLFSKEQVENGYLVLDDMPELSVEFEKKGVEMEFADYGEGREFIDSIEINFLSSLIDDEKVELGAKISDDKVLTRKISARHIKNALFSENIQEFREIMDPEKIEYMKKAFIYDEISKVYTVNSVEIKLPTKAGIKMDDDIEGYILCIVKNQADNPVIAKELSSFLISNPAERHRAIDFIMIILSYNKQEILDYLKIKNIDYINHFKPTVEDYEDELYVDVDEVEEISEDQLEVDEDELDIDTDEVEEISEDQLEKGEDELDIDADEVEEISEDQLEEGKDAEGTISKPPRKRRHGKKHKGRKIKEGRKNIDNQTDEDETIEELKGKKGSTSGQYTPTLVKKRPENVIHLQKQIKRKYEKCQICGLPVFEGKRRTKVYGHLRGHHVIPWQEKSTTFDGLLCLCQPHHHMIHHAKEVIFKIIENTKTIEVFVNGKKEGNISTIAGHDILEYFIKNADEIEHCSEDIKVEIIK